VPHKLADLCDSTSVSDHLRDVSEYESQRKITRKKRWKKEERKKKWRECIQRELIPFVSNIEDAFFNNERLAIKREQ
jgi:hypothetical protein